MSKATELIDKTVRSSSNLREMKSERNLYTRFTKRLLDIFIAAFSLLILSPFFLFIATRIRKDSPGPVFFRGERVGKDGKHFHILKFRTMYESPESYNGSRLTAEEDNRITNVGKWLRHTKINELPNLWNVLIGEMSIVGPRPEDPAFVEKWPEDARNEILSIRPGITSPASVTYREEQKLLNGNNVLDEYLGKILPKKLRMDQLYVRHQSFMGDLDVIFMTLIMILPGFESRQVKETTLYHGPIRIFSDKYLSWFASDTIVAFIAISLAVLIWRLQAPFDIGFGNMVIIAGLIAILMALINTFLGLTTIDWRYASPTHVLDLFVSTLLSIAIVFLAMYLIFPEKSLPLGAIILIGVFSLTGFVILRYRTRILTGLASRWIRWRSQSTLIGEHVLVIGAGDCAQLGIWMLEKSDLSSAFSIVGMVDDDFNKVHQRINGYTVLGTTNDLPEFIQKYNIGLVMFAINKVSAEERDRILGICRQFPVKILMIPDLLLIVKNYFFEQARKVPQEND